MGRYSPFNSFPFRLPLRRKNVDGLTKQTQNRYVKSPEPLTEYCISLSSFAYSIVKPLLYFLYDNKSRGIRRVSYLYASEEPNFLQKHHVIFPMPTSTDHSFRSRLFSREREMARPKRARHDFFSKLQSKRDFFSL